MPVRESGTWASRPQPQIIDDLQLSMIVQFGEDLDLTEGSPLQQIIEAISQTLTEAENVNADIFRQMLPPNATGEALRKHAELTGDRPLGSRRARGTVTLTLASSLSSSDYDPFFQEGDITFLDPDGRVFDLQGDVYLPDEGTTSLDVDVIARSPGRDGNISANQIVKRKAANSTVRERFDENVDSFTNNNAFDEGRNEENDIDFLRRIRRKRASRPSGTRRGIALSVDNLPDVTDVVPQDNPGRTGGTEDDIFDHDGSGTASEVIDDGTTNSRISQKFHLHDRRFIQHYHLKLNADAEDDFVGRVRIETDDGAGNPTGTLASPNLDQTGVDFDGTNELVGKFADGDYLDPGTYHLVVRREAGDGQFDGAVASEEVTNGGFETYSTSPGPPDDWSKVNDGHTVRQETTIVDAGTSAVEIESTDTTNQFKGIEQTLSLLRGLEYTFEVRARTDGNNGEIPSLAIYDLSDGTRVDVAKGTDGGTAYETLSVSFYPEPHKSYAIRLGMDEGDVSDTDVVYFDEASVQLSTSSALVFDGSWTEDANIDALMASVTGGIPPGGFRLFVDGGAKDDIAQAIFDAQPIGIPSDGPVSGTAVGRGGAEYTRYFERPIQVPVVLSVEVTKTDFFTGNEDTIREIIIEYIGGDSLLTEETYSGRDFDEKVIRNEILSRMLDPDWVTGTEDVLTLQLERRSVRASPSDLQSGDTSNLEPAKGEQFVIDDAPNDIDVTLTDVT